MVSNQQEGEQDSNVKNSKVKFVARATYRYLSAIIYEIFEGKKNVYLQTIDTRQNSAKQVKLQFYCLQQSPTVAKKYIQISRSSTTYPCS